MRLLSFVYFSGLILSGFLQAQSPPNAPADPDASRTVLVVLSTRYMFVSHSHVKPGKIRFLLENHTPLDTADLQITSVPAGSGPANAAVVEKPANGKKHNRNAFDATLTPGTYALSIRGVKAPVGQIQVQP